MVKLQEWKQELKNHKRLIFTSLVFLIVAIAINFISGDYVSEVKGAEVPDLILDHTPSINLNIIFVYGNVLVIAALFIYPLLFRVKELHNVISQFSLLVLVRALFISFTHLSTPTVAILPHYPWPLSLMDFKNDLFFSGHTAGPFLGFLLFKNSKVGYFFLAASIVMAVTVLLMHIHYSIDVLSAFFITYGTFKIGKWLFKKIHD